ncbi:unnamed protein product [Paramecium primaurelia]|uniref:Uncharacterized protein n=1 Tax=Paramecium primaurelia TaxID=5886 RepID=A0A8S1QG85_PARPR|nr:unnamed protein product [Paramecium primaurelia]
MIRRQIRYEGNNQQNLLDLGMAIQLNTKDLKSHCNTSLALFDYLKVKDLVSQNSLGCQFNNNFICVIKYFICFYKRLR